MAQPESRNALEPGSLLHWYRIERILGQGGFGITYLADDTNLDQKVAIKEYLPIEFAVRDGNSSVYPASSSHGERYKWGLERFITEARTLAKFKHRSIVHVLSVFEANNTAYMVMEYERGKTLQEVLDLRKTLTEEELIRLVKPLLGGLEVLHAGGFIHRDIKPANIFVRQKGPAVLLDFGSARQAMGTRTRTLTTIVSPGYAPFEQYYTKSDRQGPWTDIYSLAATIYRGIAGRAPLDAVDRSEAILKAERDIFVSASEVGSGRYSERFLHAIDAALKFRENERPRSIAQWRELFDFTATVPVPVPVPGAAADSARRAAETDRTFAIPTPHSELGYSTRIPVDPSLRSTAPDRGQSRSWRPGRGTRIALIATGLVIGGAAYLELSAEPHWRLGRESIASAVARIGSDPSADVAPQLAAAEAAVRAGRLLGAAPDSALAIYQTILARTPGQADARAGLMTVARALLVDTRAAIDRNEFDRAERQLADIGGFAADASDPVALSTELEVVDKLMADKRYAHREIDRLRQALRDNVRAGRYGGAGPENALTQARQLLALASADDQVQADLAKVAAEAAASGQRSIAGGELEFARQQLELAQALAPDLAATRQLADLFTEAETGLATEAQRTSTLDSTLAQANTDLDAFRLTGPPQSNAYLHYRSVLEIDPGNAAAQAGLERIVSAYLRLAAEAQAEDDIEQARVYLSRAQRVAPADARLNKALGAVAAVKVAPAPTAQPVQSPADSAPDTAAQEKRRQTFEEDLLRLGR